MDSIRESKKKGKEPPKRAKQGKILALKNLGFTGREKETRYEVISRSTEKTNLGR